LDIIGGCGTIPNPISTSLLDFVRRSTGVVITPNIATETSNLISAIGEPAYTELAITFRDIMSRVHEDFVPSAAAVKQDEFPRLWLTDSAILAAMNSSLVLLTADLQLYLAALRRGHNAVNFHHLRQL
jgi:hypothetical protein